MRQIINKRYDVAKYGEPKSVAFASSKENAESYFEIRYLAVINQANMKEYGWRRDKPKADYTYRHDRDDAWGADDARIERPVLVEHRK